MKDLHKTALVLTIIPFLFSNSTSAQSLDYGVKLIYNASTQTNYDPTLSQDGRFQWNSLGTFGAGVYVAKRMNTKYISTVSLLYQQKGFKELGQFFGGPINGVIDNQVRNTFDYICADAQFEYIALKGKSIDLAVALGIEYNRLLKYNVRSRPLSSLQYPDQWRKTNWSIIPSVVLHFNKISTLEFGFNRSLTPVLETSTLVVRDWIWTVRAGIAVPELFDSR